MKKIFSCSEIVKGQETYHQYIGIDETKNELEELKRLKNIIELEIYYKLDKIVTIGDSNDR